MTDRDTIWTKKFSLIQKLNVIGRDNYFLLPYFKKILEYESLTNFVFGQ